jgi:hypothetical protein
MDEDILMGLESETAIALHEANYESYWKHGVCYVYGEDTPLDKNNIVAVANTVLNSDSEFFAWKNLEANNYNQYGYGWCIKTRSR